LSTQLFVYSVVRTFLVPLLFSGKGALSDDDDVLMSVCLSVL